MEENERTILYRELGYEVMNSAELVQYRGIVPSDGFWYVLAVFGFRVAPPSSSGLCRVNYPRVVTNFVTLNMQYAVLKFLSRIHNGCIQSRK
jgi:hypothetical protein